MSHYIDPNLTIDYIQTFATVTWYSLHWFWAFTC